MRSFSRLAVVAALAASVSAQDVTTTTLTDAAPDAVGTLNVTQAVVNATNSGIDLSILNITLPALNYISNMSAAANTTSGASRRKKRTSTLGAIDVHSHLVFPWYRELVPTTGGEPTPDWSAPDHLSFAAQYDVYKSVLANSAPQSNVFLGQQALTVALARLINIATAAVVALDPVHFNFFCVVPLPYAQDAINEAKYCLDTLGGVGVTTTTNHEGYYLGNPKITPFFQYLNTRSGKTIVYIHPTAPYLREGGQFIEANPTVYETGLVEFYFETARCLMDLTYSQTLQNFTNIQYISAHVGGAFPSILDRMIKSEPQLIASSEAIYSSRIWWDSAGPTYPNQVKGLVGYGIPNSQLVFGTDYPYAPSVSYTPSYQGLVTDTSFTQTQIQAILSNNTIALFGNKIKW